jgi:multisubunit Na+/H+ antiporter MnhF subunit
VHFFVHCLAEAHDSSSQGSSTHGRWLFRRQPNRGLTEAVLLAIAIVLVLNTIPCIYQAINPTIQDSVISINIMNTKTVVIMLLLSTFFGQEMYLDVSFVFAFLYFVVVYGVSRYLEEKGGPLGKPGQ